MTDFIENLYHIHILPSSRSGLYQSINNFGQIFAELSQYRQQIKSDFKIPSFTEPVSDYYLTLSQTNTAHFNEKLRKIAEKIEDEIFEGKISFDNTTKKIFFSPNNQTNKTLENINELFDFEKQNVQSLNYTVENLNKLISTYGKTGTALNAKINDLGKTLDNLEGFTGTLNDKSESLGTSLDNIEQLTNNLKDIEVKQTLNNLQEATGKLNTALNAVNSSDNTVGALLNDKELYNDLDRAIVNLNLLLKDVRINPGRYITIQVFGKKNKEEPITEDEGYVK